MLRFPFIAIVLAAAGCADPAQTETNEPDEVTTDGPQPYDHPTTPDDEGGLDIAYGFYNPSCDQALLEFEIIHIQYPDGSDVAAPICVWTFDDGGTFAGCTGSHVFPEGGTRGFQITVTDPATQTTTTEVGTTRVFEPYIASLAAFAPKCGLSVEADADANLPSFVHVSISPEENVVGDAFYIGTNPHAFEVTQPGTYVVTMHGEDERQAGPICTIRQDVVVEVKACEPPPCGSVMADAAAQ
jgi:hypothetical protein